MPRQKTAAGWTAPTPLAIPAPAQTESVAERTRRIARRARNLYPGTLKPIFSWPGGKRWLIPRLREQVLPDLMPGIQSGSIRLVEPFAGSLSVALGLQAHTALLNDWNAHLIAVYGLVQSGKAFARLPAQTKAAFEQTRDEFNQGLRRGDRTSSAQAARFFYLQRLAFNSICKWDKAGNYTGTWGKRASADALFVDPHAYARQMRHWTFTTGDFQQLALRPGDLVYADPPYDMTWADYTEEGFSYADQMRLAAWLAGHDGPVVLSNHMTGRLIEAYHSMGFHIELLDKRFTMGGGDSEPTLEVLASRGVPGRDVRAQTFYTTPPSLEDQREILDAIHADEAGTGPGYTSPPKVIVKRARKTATKSGAKTTAKRAPAKRGAKKATAKRATRGARKGR